MILIDSDILIWILRNSREYKEKFQEAVSESNANIFITPIQYMEIISGVREKERIETELFMDSIEHIAIDINTGKLAGEYLRLYSKSHGVHIADALIAATAEINGLKLWTNNKKHYPMIKADEFYD